MHVTCLHTPYPHSEQHPRHRSATHHPALYTPKQTNTHTHTKHTKHTKHTHNTHTHTSVCAPAPRPQAACWTAITTTPPAPPLSSPHQTARDLNSRVRTPNRMHSGALRAALAVAFASAKQGLNMQGFQEGVVIPASHHPPCLGSQGVTGGANHCHMQSVKACRRRSARCPDRRPLGRTRARGTRHPRGAQGGRRWRRVTAVAAGRGGGCGGGGRRRTAGEPGAAGGQVGAGGAGRQLQGEFWCAAPAAFKVGPLIVAQGDTQGAGLPAVSAASIISNASVTVALPIHVILTASCISMWHPLASLSCTVHGG
jgi:hypothetical protein